MAGGARGSPRRLLAFVFAVAAAVTAVLSLDATVVLLTPVVFATASRLRTSPQPHVYACSHLANSASLLLPVSNLTNLLAFHASRPLVHPLRRRSWRCRRSPALGVEWTVLPALLRDRPGAPARARVFAGPAARAAAALRARRARPHARRLRAQLAVGIAPVWVAVAGAAAISAPALARRATTPLALASPPSRLPVFVLGLGVSCAPASDNGLARRCATLLPGGNALPALLLIAALSAILANLVNNLPATLILVPGGGAAGAAAVLAVLIGVNVGPNLTYVGSLATLLWRRVLHVEDHRRRARRVRAPRRAHGAAGLVGAPVAPMVRRAGAYLNARARLDREDTWEATVAEAAGSCRPTRRSRCCTSHATDVEELAGAAPPGLLGRPRPVRRPVLRRPCPARDLRGRPPLICSARRATRSAVTRAARQPAP